MSEEVQTKIIEHKIEKLGTHLVAQVPGDALGEHEFIDALRKLGLIEQPAVGVDVYAPGVEILVDHARHFFQSRRGVPCGIEFRLVS